MVSEAARRPIAGSASTLSPSVDDSTTNSTLASSRRAPTTNSSASAPRGTIDFTPSSTKPSSVRRAVVRGSRTSKSGRGSVSASAAAGTLVPGSGRVNAGR